MIEVKNNIQTVRMQEGTATKQTKAAKHAATRTALLRVARQLFADNGFAETGTEEVVREADVTRGALYYHFADKAALFEGVLEQVATEISNRVMANASTASNSLAALRAGCHAFLDISEDAALCRIYLIDAPAVLGWRRWRELDSRFLEGGLRQGVAAALKIKKKEEDADVIALAHLLAGALNEAALWLAEGGERKAVEDGLDLLLKGFKLNDKQKP
jgi:AcrR family transcriptional regulator